MLDAGNVLITDADGTIEAIMPIADAGDDIQYFNNILCPGFVNAHCHIELSHLKGKIPERTGLVDFVQQVMKQRTVAEDEKAFLTVLVFDEIERFVDGNAVNPGFECRFLGEIFE